MKSRPGRPAFVPTKQQRTVVTALAACGTRQALIAEHMKLDRSTLRKHFKKELTEGLHDINARIATSLVQKALAGDTVSQLFWLKCRAGWRETANLAIEHGMKMPTLDDLQKTIRVVHPNGDVLALTDPDAMIERAPVNQLEPTSGVDWDHKPLAKPAKAKPAKPADEPPPPVAALKPAQVEQVESKPKADIAPLNVMAWLPTDAD